MKTSIDSKELYHFFKHYPFFVTFKGRDYSLVPEIRFRRGKGRFKKTRSDFFHLASSMGYEGFCIDAKPNHREYRQKRTSENIDLLDYSEDNSVIDRNLESLSSNLPRGVILVPKIKSDKYFRLGQYGDTTKQIMDQWRDRKKMPKELFEFKEDPFENFDKFLRAIAIQAYRHRRNKGFGIQIKSFFRDMRERQIQYQQTQREFYNSMREYHAFCRSYGLLTRRELFRAINFAVQQFIAEIDGLAVNMPREEISGRLTNKAKKLRNKYECCGSSVTTGIVKLEDYPIIIKDFLEMSAIQDEKIKERALTDFPNLFYQGVSIVWEDHLFTSPSRDFPSQPQKPKMNSEQLIWLGQERWKDYESGFFPYIYEQRTISAFLRRRIARQSFHTALEKAVDCFYNRENN